MASRIDVSIEHRGPEPEPPGKHPNTCPSCHSHYRDEELDETLLELPESAFEDDAGGDDDFDPDEDPLLDRAIEIVVQTQTASVSLLQRRLRVGYTRAGRLIDMLERRGIISGYEGSKPRRVLVEEHQLATLISPSA